MESSSIVSFNNDSTFQTTLKGDFSNVSAHELALHAMRDRCLLLQRRINSLENDNMRLKLDLSKSANSQHSPDQENEKLSLQQKVLELTKQKSQLMHHVFMVSCENKNLWTKISTLKSCKSNKENTKHPLLRTNTYIQSTSRTSENNQEKYPESSLEEISLKLINSYIQEKSELVEQYEQMAQMQNVDDDILNINSIGFAYIDDTATDSLKDIFSKIEKLQELKNELAQQEKDLKIIISRIEGVLQGGYKCPTCRANNEKITTSEHKEIETSDSLANFATPVDSTNYNDNFSELNSMKRNQEHSQLTKEEGFVDKICPMCGVTFQSDIAFTDFQSHVESHFIGETEPDSVIDNFDVVPNSFNNGL